MTPQEAEQGRFVFCLTCGEVLESEDLPGQDLTLPQALSPAHAVAYEKFAAQHRGHRVAFSIQPEGFDHWLRVTIGAFTMSDRQKKREQYYRDRLRNAVTDVLAITDPDDPIGPGSMTYAQVMKHAADRLAAESVAVSSQGPDDGEGHEVCALSACGGPVSMETRVWSAVDGVFCSDAHYQQFREAKLTPHPSSEELPALSLTDD